MMGKAAIGFIPSKLTRIRHGAYKPIPSVISAPSRKLIATAAASFAPVSSSAKPPLGSWSRFMSANSTAATESAIPMPS